MAKATDTQKADASALKGLAGTCKAALTGVAQQGAPVQVVGRVKNGKLEIDQSSVEEFARKFPRANMTFVAVNAPFDPAPYIANN